MTKTIKQQIITSLIDTDLYKFSMMQIAFLKFRDSIVEIDFKCRSEGVELKSSLNEIKIEINQLMKLGFNRAQVDLMKENLPFLKEDFLESLIDFKFNSEDFIIQYSELNSSGIEIKVKGLWWQTILFEIFVLSIVNEVYFSNQTKSYSDNELESLYKEGFKRLDEKIAKIKVVKDFKFADFGTRRRFSKDWQDVVVNKLVQEVPDNFIGTSNVNLAFKYKIKPVGTMAHEYLQVFQSLASTIGLSQKEALKLWIKEFDGDLGIALTDVIGMDYFLKDFDRELSNSYAGLRHDSGCPFVWAEKAIGHYEKSGIDPKTKMLVFSDGLNVEKSLELFYKFRGRINVSFGIGTNLTNDLGLKPISIVMKVTKCNGKDVAKISDSQGKTMCTNESYVSELLSIFKNKPELTY
jgi:nicotinate phosphoribosyltransferase